MLCLWADAVSEGITMPVITNKDKDVPMPAPEGLMRGIAWAMIFTLGCAFLCVIGMLVMRFAGVI